MTGGKREPPLRLDMPFDEALARFARTDPSEMRSDNTAAQPRERRMGRPAKPFEFTLEPAEIEQITEAEVVGSGGLQSLLRRLQAELERGNVVTLDDAELGELIRYITRYDPEGGFEMRLRRAFIRSIYDLFAIKVAL